MIISLLIINIIVQLNLFVFQGNIKQDNSNKVILDCHYTFEEAVRGRDIPKSILKELELIDVEYFSFDGKLHKGQLVINKSLSKDIEEIFAFIKKTKFPVAKVIPVVKYNWSDEKSMNENNTSAFNYRKVAEQKVLSPHAKGLAIDINPLQNPHIKRKKVNPPNASYNINQPGTILRNSELVNEFLKRGWQWGGSWKSSKDYQHFQKLIN